MEKRQNYGFKTPKRRDIKNVTGFKVGGALTGGECKILKSNQIVVDKAFKQNIIVSFQNATKLFNLEVAVFAMGGYFYSNAPYSIKFEIICGGQTTQTTKIGESGTFMKIGLDFELPFANLNLQHSIIANITITSDAEITLNYWLFDAHFIQKDYFQQNNVHAPYNNSKKLICFPEQFYSDRNFLLEGSTKGMPFILKACNRCQRFLPINHINERAHIAFTNHCSTKAPCTHGNFSNYKIIETDLTAQELTDYVQNDTIFTLNDEFLMAYYGHQLECKACKKFFVNSALNPQRTSSQHREDSLRRRAFEVLILRLINQDWIYHAYRLNHKNKEFDQSIWEKFDKKCFKCKTPLDTPKAMELDHTFPLVFLYNLDESATCLCKNCNSSKSDSFPVDFYTQDELVELSTLTKIPLEDLKSKKPNQKVINLLYQNIIWFFEEFLMFEEFHKERDGKKAVDSICHSLQKIILQSDTPFNLNDVYEAAKAKLIE